MKKVNFTEMKNGTKEDYMFLDKLEKEYVGETADRILGFLSRMTSTLEGYKISRLEHSLQSATRAYKNKESEEMVVACLLHDIGDELAPLNHSEYAATASILLLRILSDLTEQVRLLYHAINLSLIHI